MLLPKSKESLNFFCVLRAQSCPQRAMPVALWRTGLLLSLLTVCACLGKMTLSAHVDLTLK